MAVVASPCLALCKAVLAECKGGGGRDIILLCCTTCKCAVLFSAGAAKVHLRCVASPVYSAVERSCTGEIAVGSSVQGLVWMMRMYTVGVCADYRWVYDNASPCAVDVVAAALAPQQQRAVGDSMLPACSSASRLVRATAPAPLQSANRCADTVSGWVALWGLRCWPG